MCINVEGLCSCVAVCVVSFPVTKPAPLQTEWVINRVDAQRVALSLTLNTHTHTLTQTHIRIVFSSVVVHHFILNGGNESLH